jgi:alpha-galactosidase
MQRRHFLKLTATAGAAILFSRITYATSGLTTTINTPDEVWAQSGEEWFKLKATGGNKFSYKDIEVTVKANGNAKGVYVQSPTQQLNSVRLRWKHHTAASAKYLGDHWERSYGDLQWKSGFDGRRSPGIC